MVKNVIHNVNRFVNKRRKRRTVKMRVSGVGSRRR